MQKHSKPVTPKRAALRARWREHLAAWRESGLSQVAFCRKNDLPIHSFRWWKRRLAELDAASCGAVNVSGADAFAPVRIVPSLEDQTQHQTWASEWVFTGGAKLRLAGVPDQALLKQLLELEEDRSCG